MSSHRSRESRRHLDCFRQNCSETESKKRYTRGITGGSIPAGHEGLALNPKP